MRKRERFIISSILLAVGLLATQFVPIGLRPVAIVLFFLASYFISAWAMGRSINGVEWITIVPFPSFYALCVSLFYFLLPSHFLSRIAIILLFGVGMYALYLTSNIFAIGKLKTIQLLRAAHAVSFLFLLLISLFMCNFIFSFRLYPFLNGPLVTLGLFIPLLCASWAISLEQKLSVRLLAVTGVFALLLGEVAFVISFFPIGLWTASLFLTSVLYVGFGIIQNYLVGRLFPKTLREYLWLAAFVTTSFFLLVEWK